VGKNIRKTKKGPKAKRYDYIGGNSYSNMLTINKSQKSINKQTREKPKLVYSSSHKMLE